MIIVSTSVSEDGVIGLNPKRYLLDENDELMLFKSIDEARQFIKDNGEDPDNEYIDYEEHKSEKELWGVDTTGWGESIYKHYNKGGDN